MRRLLLTTVTLAAVMCAFTDGYAFDVKRKFMISALGGVSIPLGDFADSDSSNSNAGGAKVGYDLGIAVEYGISDEILIGTRFAYSRFEVDRDLMQNVLSDTVASDSGAFDGHWTIVEYFGVYCKYLMLPNSQTRPYLSAGAFIGTGKLTVDNSPVGSWSGRSDMSLGLSAAVGLTHKVSSRIGIGLEGRLSNLFLRGGDSFEDFDAGLAARAATPAGVRDPGGNLLDVSLEANIGYIF